MEKKRCILTSDYKIISSTAIRRIFSNNKPSDRKIPILFLFDCCSGDNIKSKNFREGSEDEEVGKNGHSPSYRNAESGDGGEIWGRGEDDPDFKLVIIRGANEGF